MGAFFVYIPCGPPANHSAKGLMLAASFYQSVHLSNQMDAFFVYVPYGPSANPSAKGLVFSRLAKVTSRVVWSIRALRKSFPERFGVSAHCESRFPKGLAFPRIAKVTSQMVCDFRAW